MTKLVMHCLLPHGVPYRDLGMHEFSWCDIPTASRIMGRKDGDERTGLALQH